MPDTRDLRIEKVDSEIMQKLKIKAAVENTTVRQVVIDAVKKATEKVPTK